MNDFNRKVEDASARISQTINDAVERLEKEIPEIIKYLNDEVVPAARTHSTKALRDSVAKAGPVRRLYGAAPESAQVTLREPTLYHAQFRQQTHASDRFARDSISELPADIPSGRR